MVHTTSGCPSASALRKVEKYVILTIGTSTSLCSMSIIRDAENVFYVFDLHLRGENGLPASDGKAILTLQSLENFKPFLTQIAVYLHTGHQNELTSLILTNEKSDNGDWQSLLLIKFLDARRK
ncbi:hypothetical protein RRG08_006190 [Elysia crispata]|uniref:Uncharacterized protein n=1 Tax=Elysia crispata TaxID=231223 RepID=A0AAE1DRK2_9GAST|nr:hypothetical protein RRG08_006190 [Elysia crispata]